MVECGDPKIHLLKTKKKMKMKKRWHSCWKLKQYLGTLETIEKLVATREYSLEKIQSSLSKLSQLCDI